MVAPMDNIFSEYLKKPIDSPEQQRLRDELWLVGPAHACRYYLSILIGQDLYAKTAAEFLATLREYVVRHASPEARQFCITEYHLQFVLPFLKHQYGAMRQHKDQTPPSVEDQALLVLLQHPDWTDAEVCATVGTTENPLKRCSTFTAARVAQAHYRNGVPGWC
jgi:hypothetical protein